MEEESSEPESEEVSEAPVDEGEEVQEEAVTEGEQEVHMEENSSTDGKTDGGEQKKEPPKSAEQETD